MEPARRVMIRTPLPLFHSWPLFDAPMRLEGPASQAVGHWDCDLADNRLTWSDGVYDLFGLPRGVAVERALAVSLYRPESRSVMEELRAYAIRHRRGFTVDVAIRQAGGAERWMRLSAAPVMIDGKVARLRGIKVDVTAAYDGPAPR